MNYLISFPRSGNTMTRYLFELMTKKPTNGLCGEPNPKDTLQAPLLHKGSDYCLHKRHDFKGVTEQDFVMFVIRHPLEATIRHNEKIRGISETQMYKYLDSWFDLLYQYDEFKGNKMCLYYSEILPIASKDSRQLYSDAQSHGTEWHRLKLPNDVRERLQAYMEIEHGYLYNKYL